MKIHILYQFKDGPWGGGNQFLKALRNEFIKLNVYEDNVNKADVVLFNSFPFGSLDYFKTIYELKKKANQFSVFHRLDGPISKARDSGIEIDIINFSFNELFVDGTIFQSNWVKIESEKIGLKINPNHAVIINAPDKNIFYTEQKIYKPSEKLKIIATSWSGNIRKGFDVYEWLDNNLDFTQYDFTFIGNSPIQFQNIIHLQPVPSEKLAQKLRENDVFLTASKIEACSNSLLEAMHCGLPSIAFNSSGNPEIVGNGGELFKKNEDIPILLKRIKLNYDQYRNNINLPDIEQIARYYYDFMKKVHSLNKIHTGKKVKKKFNTILSANKINYQIVDDSIIDKIRKLLKI